MFSVFPYFLYTIALKRAVRPSNPKAVDSTKSGTGEFPGRFFLRWLILAFAYSAVTCTFLGLVSSDFGNRISKMPSL